MGDRGRHRRFKKPPSTITPLIQSWIEFYAFKYVKLF